ncbi:MAG TPA: GNAT family N-acetyltransferase [Limnochordia bacterium]
MSETSLISSTDAEETVLAWLTHVARVRPRGRYTLIDHPQSDSVFVNRACRLVPPAEDAVCAAIEADLARRGRRPAISLRADETGDWGGALLARGYSLVGHVRLLARPLGSVRPAEAAAAGLRLVGEAWEGAASVWREVFGPAAPYLAAPGVGACLAAVSAGEAVGAGGLFVDRDRALLFGVGVRAARRGRGIGRALVRGLLWAAVRRGARWAVLQTESERAAAFYRQEGFVPLGTELIWVQAPEEARSDGAR